MEATRLLDVLALAHAHLQYGWARAAAARDRPGREVSAGEATATAWCAIGALAVASICLALTGEEQATLYRSALAVVARSLAQEEAPDAASDPFSGDRDLDGAEMIKFQSQLMRFNDQWGRGKGAVLALFERAAQRIGKG